MKFVYYDNPLRTRVYLDDHEKAEFKLKLQIEELEDRLHSVYYHLICNDPLKVLECPNPHMNGKSHLDLAKEEVDGEYIKEIKDRVEEMYDYYIADLENGYHIGDCTCFPASCSKCHAEYLLGIDTIKGLGSHEANEIDRLFTNHKYPFDVRTIDEVLDKLKNYQPDPFKPKNWTMYDQEYYESCFPRWKAEAQRAYEWLLKYKEEHR